MTTLLLLLSLFAFSLKRLLRYLRFFQQEEYNNSRFIGWLAAKQVFDRKATAAIAVAFTLMKLFPAGATIWTLSLAIALLAIAYTEEDPRKEGKITLKMTARAKRLYLVAAIITGSTVLAISTVDTHFLFAVLLLVFVQAIPLSLAGAKALLQSDEDRRQQKFLDEAKEALRRTNPFTIAITGSYGKTTTKAFLGKLLEMSLGPTFWPPKSVNTPMGITRELRENLKSGHKYAVIEMGAYQQGSIRRLCELVPPKAAIVTAVGIMHLERFGSPENVYRAKSELPQALPADSILVCNGDNPGSRRMASEFAKSRTLLYGLDPAMGHLDARIDGVQTGSEGTTFTIHWQGQPYAGFTKLHGRPALSNILASFTMAAALGADPSFLMAAIRSLEPFDNRLEVRREAGGLQINDAYNSNPDGFLAALEVLRELPGEKRILMTPGMVELGAEQESENRRIAKAAASICTDVIIVGSTNRSALVTGLEDGKFEKSKITFAVNRDDAFRVLAELRKPGDVVLIENDLPDLFEFNLKF